MSRVSFDGNLLIEPQGRWAFRVGVVAGASPLATGRVAVLGESDGGPYSHGVGGDTYIPWFSNSRDLRNMFKQGVGVKCADLIFNPSPTYSGAKEVAFLRTQVATAASANLLTNAGASAANTLGLTFTAKDKGTSGNALRVKSACSTSPHKHYAPAIGTAGTGVINAAAPTGSYVANRNAVYHASFVATADYYTGCTIIFVASNDPAKIGFTAVVVGYDSTNKTLLLDRALPSMCSTSDYFVMHRAISFSATVTTGTSFTLPASSFPCSPNAVAFWNAIAAGQNVAYLKSDTGRYYAVATVAGTTTITITIESALATADQNRTVLFTLSTGIAGNILDTSTNTTNAVIKTTVQSTATANPGIMVNTTGANSPDFCAVVFSTGAVEYLPITAISNSTVTLSITVSGVYSALPQAANTLGWFLVRGKDITVHYDANMDSIQQSQEGFELYSNMVFVGEVFRKATDSSGLVTPTMAPTAADLRTPMIAQCSSYSAPTTGLGLNTYVPFSNGTVTGMTANDIANALSLIVSEDVQFVFIATESVAQHAVGISHCLTAETPRILFCGGAVGESLTAVLSRSTALNSERAVLCWPGVYIARETDGAIALHSPMYFAALCCGLAAGIPPQLPLTRKTVLCFGFEQTSDVTTYPLNRMRREQLIAGGVLTGVYRKGEGYVVNQGVNTVQKNDQLWNYVERTSPEISLVRARDQIGRELAVGAERLAVGGNLTIITPSLVKSWMERTLDGFKERELIVDWSKLTIRQEADRYYISFAYNGNNPVNFMLITGTVVS